MNKRKLVEYKGGKCEICGYDRCINALEFHHLDPNEKEFGISNKNIRSFEKLKKEADKCILVCANCHREIHSLLNGDYSSNSEIEKLDFIKKDIESGLTIVQIVEKYSISILTLIQFLKSIKNKDSDL